MHDRKWKPTGGIGSAQDGGVLSGRLPAGTTSNTGNAISRNSPLFPALGENLEEQNFNHRTANNYAAGRQAGRQEAGR
eukprot:16441399-Heterocapsa_arctica.AAC.1